MYRTKGVGCLKKIILNLKVATPCFAGDSEPSATALIRGQSIKGLLRFWYRATHPDFHKNETEIFGSTDQSSSFQVRVSKIDSECVKNATQWDRQSGKAYLGYGLAKEVNGRKTNNPRPYFDIGTKFVLQLTFSSRIKDEQLNSVMHSLWVWLMLGGLGGRSRRGFGSLAVESIDCEAVTDTLPAWQFKDSKSCVDAIKQFIKSIQPVEEMPNYSCWTKNSKIVVVPPDKKGTTSENLLDWVGRELRYHRSFRGAKNYVGDHNLMYDFVNNGNKPKSFPLRAIYGLPHNYFFSNGGKAELNINENGKIGRRASPIFLHVQECGKQDTCAVITVLKSKFLPTERNMEVRRKTREGWDSTNISALTDPSYKAIDEFLSYLVDKHGGKEITSGGKS